MSVWVAAVALVVCFLCEHLGVTAYTPYYGHEDPSKNIIKNWDLETDLSGWTTDRAKVTQVSGGHTGSKCAKIETKTHIDGGLVIYLDTASANLKQDTNYYVSVFVKPVTNSNTGTWTLMRLLVQWTLSTAATKIVETGRLPFQRADGTWKHLGGDFRTPNEGFTKLKIFLRVDPANVGYLLDTVSLTEVHKFSNWRAELDVKIKQHRMSDVTLSAQLPAGTDLANTRITVELVRHEFCFGMAIKALLMIKAGDVYDNYREFVIDKFNCLTFENDMKWRQMEPSKGSYQTAWIDQVMDDMKPYNKTFRGHAVHWNILKNNPNWVQTLTGSALKTAILDRVDYFGNHFKGLLEDVDLCNEHEHKHFIEDGTGDVNMFDTQFQRLRASNPKMKLYINDYEVVRNGRRTSAVASRAKSMLQRGVPCDGIGIQSHLRTLPIDIDTLAKRIQIVETAGLPITITEFSVHSSSDAVKAEALEMAYTVYLSEPLVKGIYGWGFSDQKGFSFASDMYLTSGITMTPNAAGSVLVNLIKNKWHTKKVFTPTSSLTTQTFPAFHGNYKVTVTTGGNTIYENGFYASNGGSNVFSVQV